MADTNSTFLIDAKEGVQKYRVKHETIKAAAGGDILMAWSLLSIAPRTEELPPFPFQIYLTKNVHNTEGDLSFAIKFLKYVEQHSPRSGDFSIEPWQIRLDIYTAVQPSVIASIHHALLEKDHRKRHSQQPCLVSRWGPGPDAPYTFSWRNTIIVIDSDDWQNIGPIVVQCKPSESIVRGGGDGEGCFKYHPPDMIAYRTGSMEKMVDIMRSLWDMAGGTWKERDMKRRNDGGSSPVLYPAMDPAAHQDQDENLAPLLDEPEAGRQITHNSYHPHIFPYRAKTFKELFDCQADSMPRTTCETTFSDCSGIEVTSVWDVRYGKIRPAYSITLYVEDGQLPYSDRWIWFRSNLVYKGEPKRLTYKLVERPWCLDIVRGIPDVSVAFAHHEAETIRRSPTRVNNFKQVVEMMLQKATSQALPKELLDLITDEALPRPLPDYKEFPPFHRSFPHEKYSRHNCFLYAGTSSSSHGPFMVNSLLHEVVPNEPSHSTCLRVDFMSTWVGTAKLLAVASIDDPTSEPY
ncbi:hypothetical protein K431DRAFT_79712 [Polychaeton citri CBS 116435]|uniref:Uncharacterized protein n=1 Tax=Polychaeton citri CBS 116435 TaxID=1314669 RepID=A0A9P4URE2_9PEZI|nr:hypothetical protein K431DRAFT_79712 [Polychaeton citri CBS 116435]